MRESQLDQIRGKSIYKIVAQKFDMHIKSFDSDINTKLRWNWQLIQNAKDVANKFSMTKIKQSLRNDQFVSKHNGDAFSLQQLHSLVAQYSTKQQKNNQQVKTTGKYGTGFITTYILSRNLEISGVVRLRKLQEIQSQVQVKFQYSDDENQHQNVTKKPNKRQKPNKIQQKTNKIQQKTAKNKLKNKKQKQMLQQERQKQMLQQEQQDDQFIYQDFKIPIDRSYNDRDVQLPQKINKIEHYLDKLVNKKIDMNAHNHYMKDRTVDNYDTVFRYKLTDDSKFAMIQTTIKQMKLLMPYAMLFNENLNYYEFIDQRSIQSDQAKARSQKKEKSKTSKTAKKQLQICELSFCIKKLAKRILETKKYKKKQKEFQNCTVSYLLAYKSGSKILAGIPIQLKGGKIHTLLKIDQSLPLIFKDFPLIGCQPLGWNAIINSNQFYPDQKRSQLILESKVQGSKQIIQNNWKNLRRCFEAVEFLYFYLAKVAKFGSQNLLVFSDTNSIFIRYPEFKSFLTKIIVKILKIKCVPLQQQSQIEKQVVRSQNWMQPQYLNFIQIDHSLQLNANKMKFSSQANKIFRFVYRKSTLNQQFYQRYYQIFHKNQSYRKYLQISKFINFISIDECLKKISSLQTFSQFCNLIDDDIYIRKLNQIYQFLGRLNPHRYLNPQLDYKIILNKKIQLKSFKNGLKLKALPPAYQKIAQILGIQINHILIHDKIAHNFDHKDIKYEKFDIKEMQSQILRYFTPKIIQGKCQTWKFPQQNRQLQKLFQTLLSFTCIQKSLLKILRYFLIFSELKPFDLKVKEELNKFQRSQQLLHKFIQQLKNYVSQCFENHCQLQDFITEFVNIQSGMGIAFLKCLFKNKIVGQKMLQIKFRLTRNKKFVQQSKLFRLQDGIQYFSYQEIELYNLGKDQNNQEDIDQMFVHPIYPLPSIMHLKSIANHYLTFLKNIQPQNKYSQLAQPQKIQILKYVRQVNLQYDKDTNNKFMKLKHSCWKSFIDKRLRQLFEKSISTQTKMNFVFDLFNNTQAFNHLLQEYGKNNNTILFK